MTRMDTRKCGIYIRSRSGSEIVYFGSWEGTDTHDYYLGQSVIFILLNPDTQQDDKNVYKWTVHGHSESVNSFELSFPPSNHPTPMYYIVFINMWMRYYFGWLSDWKTFFMILINVERVQISNI